MPHNFEKMYKDRATLVTGHTGFMGSWLSLWLAELGAKVVGYSLRPPTHPNLFEAINLKKRIAHILGDVRDGEKLSSVFKRYRPECVFHLAAQPLVRFSYTEPKNTYETNVMGVVNILEAVRNQKYATTCVIVTSDKCYENRESLRGYEETDPMGGYDPYSSSKGCAELVVSAYRRSFFNPEGYGRAHSVSLSSVRAGNIIGGGDWAKDRLVPDCIRALSRNKDIMIRNPDAIRPWQYVLEPLSGCLLLGERMFKKGAPCSGAWNFGPDDANGVTVVSVVKLLIKYWGGGRYKIDSSIHPHESGLLKLDTSKARKTLEWRPVYDISTTVERTVKWYKSFYSKVAAKELERSMIDEISEYAGRAGYGTN